MLKEYLIVPAVDCCVHHAEGDGGGECGGGVGTRRTWHDVLTCPTRLSSVSMSDLPVTY